MKKNKITLLIHFEEGTENEHKISEVNLIGNKVEFKKQVESFDTWLYALCTTMNAIINSMHQNGIANGKETLIKCTDFLKDNYITPFFATKITSTNLRKYDRHEQFTEPISFTKNEFALLYNSLHQKNHYSETEAKIAKGLFENVGFKAEDLPSKVLEILNRNPLN